jgi:integrase
MPDQRVTVWVQRFKDRATLQLQWIGLDTGRRKTRSAKTADPKAADKARADLEYELTYGKYQEASRVTWDRFCELLEEEYLPRRRETTRKSFRNMMRLFGKVCSPRTLRGINERTVSAFVAGMRRLKGRLDPGGMAASTIRVNLAFLHAALDWAVEQKFIPACPRFPSVKVPKKRPQAVAAESFERLLAAADAPMRAYLLCGWLAGLRRNEALLLEWEQTDKAPWVDFGKDRIWLPADFVKAVEDQWVPLDPELRAALVALPRLGKKVFRMTMPSGGPITPSGLSKLLHALAAKAGVRLSMRSLRRGFGCRYAGKVPAQVLQKLMRHSNIAVTMDYYANVDSAVEEAVLGPQRNRLRNNGRENAPGLRPSECVTDQVLRV